MLRDDSGMATAEFAVALVALTGVIGFVLAGGTVVATQLQASDAARIAVRLAARGESALVISNAVQQVAPRADVSITRASDIVTAQVRLRPPNALAQRLMSTVSASARSVDESATTSAAGVR